MITGYQWELYNVAEDPTQSNDLAAKMPDKLKEMQDSVLRRGGEAQRAAARQHDAGALERAEAEPHGGRTEFTYTGALTGVPNSGAPNILNKAFTITAEVTIPKGGAEGMIVTEGGRFGGYGLFLSPAFNWWSKADFFRNLGLGFLVFGLLLVWRGRSKNWSGLKMGMSKFVVLSAALLVVAVFATRVVNIGRGKPVFLHNLLNLKRTTWAGPALGAGKHTIVFDYKPDEPGLGKSGKGVLSVDGKEVARNSMEHGTPITFPEDESFDIGSDTRTGVAMLEYRYEVPFKFTGTIDKLTFKLEPEPKAAPESKAELGPTASTGAGPD